MAEFSGLHVEPTNICTLKCPRCSRTEFLNTFGTKKWTNHNLDLAQFQQFVDLDLTDKVINLCGNYGDPIYYPELFDLVRWCKQQGARIHIRTNGSYRDVAWWQSLGEILDGHDTVFFAVDGTPENFTQYRINADWPSIQCGMRVMAQSDAQTVWRFIPFSFNEHAIAQARELSEHLGITKFEVNVSDRWSGVHDPLRPNHYQGARETAIIRWHHDKNITIDPKCSNGQEHFVSASGHCTPCCYSADHRFYYKSEFFKNQTQYHISNITLSELLLKFSEFYSNITVDNTEYCTFNCPKI